MRVQCAVAGGGPAGMMLGLLLARAGVRVVVLEKHADFLRDFRGDTIHPSTLEILHELGILDEFLKRPHQEVRELTGRVAGHAVTIADFTHLPTHCKFLALMPQWDFLDFLAEQARRFKTFDLRMQAEATDLIEEHGRVAGVRVKTPDGLQDIRADLVVGADGRRSLVRERAGLAVENLGAPIDVLWMRLSRRADDPSQALGNVEGGHIFVMFDRGDYWQCAYVIPKGGYDDIQRRGIDAFRADIASTVPFLRDRVGELRDWNEIKLLTVLVDRLRAWHRPGLLCIGDAAHAMSPIGGVGINLAIQDAVAAANILAGPLAGGTCSDADLARVQKRREWPTRIVQRVQVIAQNRVIGPALRGKGPQQLPFVLKLLRWFPMLRRIPARLVGVGIRPEHVATLEREAFSRAGPLA
ncbi:MAG TPA: FAD-dependent oxidoreductase [Vicinamibacterales bacterium]|nr:FAD-dependent oxidoreductase [Vicinamibacterales bacterium]